MLVVSHWFGIVLGFCLVVAGYRQRAAGFGWAMVTGAWFVIVGTLYLLDAAGGWMGTTVIVVAALTGGFAPWYAIQRRRRLSRQLR